jgi:hypothetical protein
MSRRSPRALTAVTLLFGHDCAARNSLKLHVVLEQVGDRYLPGRGGHAHVSTSYEDDVLA